MRTSCFARRAFSSTLSINEDILEFCDRNLHTAILLTWLGNYHDYLLSQVITESDKAKETKTPYNFDLSKLFIYCQNHLVWIETLKLFDINQYQPSIEFLVNKGAITAEEEENEDVVRCPTSISHTIILHTDTINTYIWSKVK